MIFIIYLIIKILLKYKQSFCKLVLNLNYFLKFSFLFICFLLIFLIIRILLRHKKSFYKSKIINLQIIVTINSSCHEFIINIFILLCSILETWSSNWIRFGKSKTLFNNFNYQLIILKNFDIMLRCEYI